MDVTGIVIFAITYVLIALRRLSWLGFDRPAGALLGAVCCVVFGVLTPREAVAAVDGATILLLFGVMGMGAFLAIDGLFDDLENAVSSIARTPARLLGFVVWGSGVLSAFITNDAVCVLGAPIVVRLIRRHSLPHLPFLLGLATAANTGSVATLVGNPQNMLCANLGDLSFREHLFLLGPVAAAGLALNHGLLILLFRKQLTANRLTRTNGGRPITRRSAVTLAIIAGTSVVYFAGANLAWTAVSGFVVLMLVHRRDSRRLWDRIDWSLLVFFAGLFVVVDALIKSGLPAWVFEQTPLAGAANGIAGYLRLAAIFLVGSNVVSNVPFILVVRDQMATLPDPRLGWELLAMASTFAGNLTLLGSVANIIVSESSRDIGGLGFVEYLRVGIPLAVLTTIVGTMWVVLMFGR